MAGGIALSAAMHNSSKSVIFPERDHEPTDPTVRALQAWPVHAAQPLRDGALDAQPCRSSWHGAEPIGGGILWPARLGGAVDHRSQPGVAARTGLSGHDR